MRRYRSEEAERWSAHRPREGDVVISTRSKCGTTWVQAICLLLLHGHPLPAPLGELSPWLDWEVEPVEQVVARLEAQPGRRVIKTHTPLDGFPLHPGTHHVVVGRHPLDVAVSLFHHAHNIDRTRFAELSGRPEASGPPARIEEWIVGWMDPDTSVEDELDTLPGLVHHVTDAWGRGADARVHLVHFSDLVVDREAVARRLAERLAIDVPDGWWPGIVQGSSFEAMAASAETTAPDRLGVLRDRRRFFRSGRVGDGRRTLGPEVEARCASTVRASAPPEVADWLLR